jgi:ferredoxin-NADP reductase
MDTATVPHLARALPPRRVPGARVVANATILAREDLAATIVRLRIRPDGDVPEFLPGQYLALGLEVDQRPLQRPYSTASPAGERGALEFLVRLVPDGALTPRLWRLPAGARITMGRPKGRFVPDDDDPRRPLFIATGTGIAPLMSMLETRLRDQPDGPPRRRPVVVHGVARPDELVCHERLDRLAGGGRISYVPAVSRPGRPGDEVWAGARGRVDALIEQVLVDERVDPADAVAFLCGNPGMVEAVGNRLRALGLPDDAVRSEAYWVRPPAA